MRPRLFIALLAAVSDRVSASFGPVSTLPIVNSLIAPDGFSRSSVLAGFTFPGQLIVANKGDKFSVNVLNVLTDHSMDLETSIHWHGIFQRNSNFADGGAFVNQCPIVPRSSFTYQFQSSDQTGTYWYHSHFKAQYCDGLRGPLVIYDPHDPHAKLYDVDNESTVITLADWYHDLSPQLQPPKAAISDATLINGKGHYLNGPNVALAVVNVVRGLRYRLRVVSISCEPAFTFSIDSHRLTVIEVDGINHQPLVVDSLQIFAGQRYSVVLNADQPINNYWIRAVPNVGNPNFAGETNVAVLRYSGAPTRNPSDPTQNIPQSVLPLKETDLHPLVPTPVPGKPIRGGADININLDVTADQTGFLVNGVTFKNPEVPILLQIINGVPASQLLPSGSIYAVEGGKSVEVSIPANAAAPGGPHPIHLHGHAFHVVRSAGNATYNFNNPVIRDVVSMGDPGDNVTIRFFTDNPGPWFLHCHIDFHLEAGFAVVFAEDVPAANTTLHTAAWDELCPKYKNFINSPP